MGIGDTGATLAKVLRGLPALFAVVVLTASAMAADRQLPGVQLAKSSGGWFGVRVMDLFPEHGAARGYGDDRGILVSTVVPESPAARGDLRAGDIILEVDGRRIIWFKSMIALVQSRPPGKEVEVLLYRQGERLRTLVKLGDLEDAPDKMRSAESMDREYQAGRDAYNAGRLKAAADIFAGLVDHGWSDSRFGLGYLYHHGEGRSLDHRVAAHWYRLAAEQGHRSAQHNLGLLYWNGEGVPRDLAHAYYWIKRSADAGDENSQPNEAALRPLVSSSEMAVVQDWLRYQPRAPSGADLERLQAANKVKDSAPAQRSAVQQAAKSRAPDGDVRQVQAMLGDLGYRPGPADGLMGKRTKAAIEQFQRERGLAVDGQVSQSLLASLRGAAASGREPAQADSAEQSGPSAADARVKLDDLEGLDDF